MHLALGVHGALGVCIGRAVARGMGGIITWSMTSLSQSSDASGVPRSTALYFMNIGPV